ncbi:serine/threonine protein kinase [Cystobacter fuscus]|uniref:serine/threonine-protein kinase n=1 Tax=Cystobacter fuscus TaxID=43 RepID=UPI002B2BCA72|nr:serine/threonine protein kinase [Cystobacter fuscus]
MSDEAPPRGGGDAGTGAFEEDATFVRTVIRDVIDLNPRTAPPPASPPMEPLPVVAGQILANRYTVLQVLGRGSMGVVVSAYDARLDRCVALKLLRRETDAIRPQEDLEARMVREAQAMARLSHPNVVAVYDVGTIEDGAIFIAMERVEGQTLRRWCEQAPRAWRDILTVYLGAGHGLAAAHEAGLVHRDFKPENVLVGRDERARVTDFGLARASASPTSETPRNLSLPPGALDSPLTMHGTLLGTPRYMAPELLRGEAADARSDVFAFCVALYEALYGQHPFAGATQAESIQNQREGRARPPPMNSPVPTWVERPLMQGLRADPTQRPESMRALVTALEDDPEVRRRLRRRVVAVAALMSTLSALIVGGVLMRTEREPRCARLERQLHGVWDFGMRWRVRQAILNTHLPYAQERFHRVAELLDGYSAQWVKLRGEVCSKGAEQPPPAWVARGTECLERRREQLRVLMTEVLTRDMDAEHLAQAVTAAQSLSPLEICTDSKAMSAAVPPPEEPALRARVEALQMRMDRLETLRLAGQYSEALESGTEWLREVEQVDYPHLQAQAYHQMAKLKESAGKYADAEALARQAIPLAAKSKDLVLVAQAWTVLVKQVGWRQGRYPEAMGLMLALESAVECADDDETRADALNTQAVTYQRMGQFEEALQKHEHALALRQKALGPEHYLVAASYNNLGIVLAEMGQFEQARASYDHALQLRRKTLGKDHPFVAQSYSNLGTVLAELGRHEEARDMYEHALAIRKKTLGLEHPDVASSLNNLGVALTELGRYSEALAMQESALALRQKLLGPEHPDLATPLTNLGGVLRKLHRYTEARTHLEHALALREKALGTDHPDVAEILSELGQVLADMGRHAEARAHYERALAIQQKALRPGHPSIAASLTHLGELLVRMKRGAEALPLLERALTLSPEPSRAELRALMERAREGAPGNKAPGNPVATPVP